MPGMVPIGHATHELYRLYGVAQHLMETLGDDITESDVLSTNITVEGLNQLAKLMESKVIELEEFLVTRRDRLESHAKGIEEEEDETEPEGAENGVQVAMQSLEQVFERLDKDAKLLNRLSKIKELTTPQRRALDKLAVVLEDAASDTESTRIEVGFDRSDS